MVLGCAVTPTQKCLILPFHVIQYAAGFSTSSIKDIQFILFFAHELYYKYSVFIVLQ